MHPTQLSYQCDLHAQRDAERSRTVIDVGPFRALLDPGTDLIWLNYAVPRAPSAPQAVFAEALAALGQVFRTHQRTLRFEFNALPSPALPAVLEAAGLRRHAEHPLMVCAPARLTPVTAPDIRVRVLDADATDAELRMACAIQRVSFGGEERDTTDAEVAELRAALHAGEGLHAIATEDDGRVVGVAGLTVLDASAELVGVATAPTARRRGVAATLSSFLVQTHAARGGTLVWLSAGDAVAEAVYQKIGFQRIDTRLNYIADREADGTPQGALA